jgi:2-succinyl-5-enolpyruvyl-6-hydroxy-3-cyclohexene-1-carboxylate synthase
MMSNMKLAQAVLQSLLDTGVRELVLCAGARNAPFVALLSRRNPFTTYSFFEERSAGFFALGRIMATRRPVAVITTSGTAVAELLPATIESDYQGLPLILVTADRPKSYRGSGSPQTIVQPGIYSHYVENCFDLEKECPPIPLSGHRPVHVNVCFDEPLLDGEPGEWVKAKSSTPGSSAGVGGQVEFPHSQPVIMVSGLTRDQSEGLLPVLRNWNRPLFLEATSQLRGHPELAGLELCSGERIVRHIRFDSVIRIGGIPVSRYWRDLEKSELPVFNFSALPFSGLARTREVYPFEDALRLAVDFKPVTDSELDFDRERARHLERLLTRFPLSEPAWIRWLSRQMRMKSRVYLGNSLPIREWDLAAARGGSAEVFASRGVNGIDGQISTFLGVGEVERDNWCVVGDLTALYDLTAPWILRERPLRQASIAIVNNGGGKIFERIFRNRLFENPHQIQFCDWARMWNLNYNNLRFPVNLTSEPGVRVLEILPESDQTQAFYQEWDR